MALLHLFRRIPSRRLRVLLGVLLIGGVIIIDLLFSAHPALSIGIFLGAVVLLLLGSLAHTRQRH
jgi:uncharacterized membrane protein